jgi:bacterioferritin
LDRVIFALNQALASELVCVLGYKRHCYSAQGLNAQAGAAEFLQHAGEEAHHANLIAARIT